MTQTLCVLVPHRLRAAREIHDGEPPVAEMEASRLVDEVRLAVRPAVGQGRRHGAEIVTVPGTHEADDAAHQSLLPKLTSSRTR